MTTRCLFIYPKYTLRSFWNFTATCEVQNAKYPAIPLGLITVAAMLPADWEVRLLDGNTEEFTDEQLRWADLVFTGGMLSQQGSTLRIIAAAQKLGKPVVVGGPDATSSPHIYDAADHLVLGEAEVTLPRWLDDYRQGAAAKVYDPGPEKANITQSPTPRFDLLKLDNYLYPGVQFARGCPFLCEFCDIIELFGRVPRLKQPEQLLQELSTLHQLGYRGVVDIVDDNFIGNKRDVKKFLPHLIEWQQKHRFPFEFSTEASVNLADDNELLDLMQQANFVAVFVGIESPDEVTLRQTQKAQNTRRELSESLRKIYSKGMWVTCGYILGFDSERGSVEPGIVDLIEASATPIAMVGMLYALPGTQLTKRLAREGRLFDTFDTIDEVFDGGDQCTTGLNFDTARPRLDIYRDLRNVLQRIYEPTAYFGRVRRVCLELDCSQKKLRLSAKYWFKNLRGLMRLLWRQGVKAPYRRQYWSTLWTVMRKNPDAIRFSINLSAFFIHFSEFSQFVLERIDAEIARLEAIEHAKSVDDRDLLVPLGRLTPNVSEFLPVLPQIACD